jgi:hypothetical protein
VTAAYPVLLTFLAIDFLIPSLGIPAEGEAPSRKLQNLTESRNIFTSGGNRKFRLYNLKGSAS